MEVATDLTPILTLDLVFPLAKLSWTFVLPRPINRLFTDHEKAEIRRPELNHNS